MRRLLLPALTVSLAAPALAQTSGGDGLSVMTGVDYSSGSYGTDQDTDILVVPFSLRYRTGDMRLSATLPYLSIDGGSSIVGGGGGPIIIDPNSPPSKRDGFGDVTLGATFAALKEETAGFAVDLGATVKLPAADADNGLGTGETDYGVTVDISKSFGDFIPFVTLGYRMPGDPDGVDLNNAFTASVGTSVTFGSSVLVVSYDHREAISDLVEDSREIFGAFSSPLGDALNWTLYGTAGLSDGAPDFGAGLMLTYKIS